MRQEVQDFRQACETLAEVAHQHALTDEERGIVSNLVRALEQEVALSPPQPDEETPLAATLSHMPLID